MPEYPIVKELRDEAALMTKGAPNPFAARKDALEWRAADLIEELTKAGERVLAGLNARIAAAPSTSKPVFDGIADLHDAVNRASR